MKVKIAFDWDRMAQKELGVELDIPEHTAQALIKSHFNKLDYPDRQRWIHNNIDNENVKHISEDELDHE
jgi:DNA polymerase I-like protein with 3'-5' exonuclease and polymerase domains